MILVFRNYSCNIKTKSLNNHWFNSWTKPNHNFSVIFHHGSLRPFFISYKVRTSGIIYIAIHFVNKKQYLNFVGFFTLGHSCWLFGYFINHILVFNLFFFKSQILMLIIYSTQFTFLGILLVGLCNGFRFRWFPTRSSSYGVHSTTITVSHTNFGNNRTPPPPTMYAKPCFPSTNRFLVVTVFKNKNFYA